MPYGALRPDGAAWASAPSIRTLGVRLLYIFLVAFILIMVGELADKSQLLALLLATRYKAWQVLIGIFIATFVVHFFTALAGQLLGSAIPQNAIPWITGVLFIGFGIWTLRGDKVEDSEADKGGRFGPIIATTIAFFLAELGDKTQIMTLAIAVDPGSAILVYLKGAGPTVQGWLATVGSPANVSAMGSLLGGHPGFHRGHGRGRRRSDPDRKAARQEPAGVVDATGVRRHLHPLRRAEHRLRPSRRVAVRSPAT